MKNVTTRFAPSPTGYLHIGGARTALFNYLFARHHNGRYLVRIEDTDKARSTPQAIEAIEAGLNWLGLTGDETFVIQSERLEAHRTYAEQMLKKGTAYKCYLTDEELDEIRAQAKADGRPVRSPWRDQGGYDRSPPSHNAPFTVRIKMPSSGHTIIHDMVQGEVRVENSTLDDFVLLRSDGTPTYMLAVVCDDHNMGISHVIRGDDHLNNAFRQYYIYQGLGWEVPIFGHIPLIHGTDGAKLSKRHKALEVEAYRDMGFLPETMINYLARLGWSHGDDELFSIEQAITWFDGQHIGKAPAKFDLDKLKSVNQYWLRQARSEDLANMLIDRYKGEHPIPAETKSQLKRLMPLFTERAQTLRDLEEMTGWLFRKGAPQLSQDEQNLLDKQAMERLHLFSAFLDHAPQDKEDFQQKFSAWLADNQFKMKDIGLPLRLSLTGTKSAPSIVDIVLGLGFDEVKNRLNETYASQTI